MIQKCSNYKVLEVFFKEPTTIHFIREISRKIKLAPTSVRIILTELVKENMILSKKSKPFDGFIANRDNNKFIFLKRALNLSNLYELVDLLKESIHPLAIVLFGSYSRGEDVETSDIDLFVLSKVKKNIDFSSIEKNLKRTINLMIIDDINKIDVNIIKKIHNGIVLSGEI